MLVLEILFAIWFFGTLFLPYIVGAILSVIIIFLIRKKFVGKYQKLKILVYPIIIILCLFISSKLGYPVMEYLSEKPDKVYTEMKKINDSGQLIGLSKDEVVELLGNPLYKEDDDSLYVYDAGKTTNYFLLGARDFYDLFIYFDESDRVKSTKIYFPRGG